MLTIISVGKDHDPMFRPAIEYYEKKLRHYNRFTWLLIKPSGLDGGAARGQESSKILACIKNTDFVLLLDETGEMISSPGLANILEGCQNTAQSIVVIVGGPHGVDSTVMTRANKTIAFGKAVFPHQLVRVMALEQLYRAYSILSGSKYHHE